MKLTFLVFGLILQNVYGVSQVNVRLPFLNPAGVTYINGPAPTGLVAGPVPLHYQQYQQYHQQLPQQVTYTAAPVLRQQQVAYTAVPQVQQHVAYTATPPVQQHVAYTAAPPIQQHVAYTAAPPVQQQVAYTAAPVFQQQQQVAYAAAPIVRQPQQVAYTAAPFIHQPLRAVPVQPVAAVADIPVTQIEAHHGVVQKLVDVVNPAIKTRKYEVRRPAIQKQFYDIEERVIVRPAGTAVVELDHPISEKQKGVDIITPIQQQPRIAGVVPHPQFFVSTTQPTFVQTPVYVSTTPAPVEIATVTPTPSDDQYNDVVGSSTPFPQPSGPERGDQNVNDYDTEDTDSVVVGARSQQQNQNMNVQPIQRSNLPSPSYQTTINFQQLQQSSDVQPQQQQVQFRNQNNDHLQRNQQFQLQQLQQQQQSQLQQLQQRHLDEQQQQQDANVQFDGQQLQDRQIQQQQQFDRDQGQQQQQFNSQPQQFQQIKAQQPFRGDVSFRTVNDGPRSIQVESQSNGDPSYMVNQRSQQQNNAPITFSRQSTPDELRNNQQQLIQLLTARNGGVSEVGGFSNDNQRFVALRSNENDFYKDAGVVRGRVLQATPAPLNAEPTDERVNTRRVVLSRPIETIQEVEVNEPFTKVDRVSVNAPVVYKTARVGVQRVQVPAVPAVPVFQNQVQSNGQYTTYN